MVLDYLGISRSQETLARQLGVRPPLGVAAPNIQKLNSGGLTAVYEPGTLETTQSWLDRGIPVIAFIQAGELSHWFGHRFQHAVLVIGLDKQSVYLLDPATDESISAVSHGDFMLAWDEMDNTMAVITKRKHKQ